MTQETRDKLLEVFKSLENIKLLCLHKDWNTMNPIYETAIKALAHKEDIMAEFNNYGEYPDAQAASGSGGKTQLPTNDELFERIVNNNEFINQLKDEYEPFDEWKSDVVKAAIKAMGGSASSEVQLASERRQKTCYPPASMEDVPSAASPANSSEKPNGCGREIRALTEKEFIGLWANETWARSTFRFLERDGLRIMKETEPVSLSDIYNKVLSTHGSVPDLDHICAVLQAARVIYED